MKRRPASLSTQSWSTSVTKSTGPSLKQQMSIQKFILTWKGVWCSSTKGLFPIFKSSSNDCHWETVSKQRNPRSCQCLWSKLNEPARIWSSSRRSSNHLPSFVDLLPSLIRERKTFQAFKDWSPVWNRISNNYETHASTTTCRKPMEY